MIFVCFFVAAILASLTVWFNLIQPKLRYDIQIDDELIEGTHLRFRRDLHELELTNPETRKTTIVVYRMFQIKRVYLRRKKG